jgi:hypothetical protein
VKHHGWPYVFPAVAVDTGAIPAEKSTTTSKQNNAHILAANTVWRIDDAAECTCLIRGLDHHANQSSILCQVSQMVIVRAIIIPDRDDVLWQ